MKNTENIFETPKGAFRARKTLQKIRCSTLRQMRVLFSRFYAFSSVKRKLRRL